MVTASCYQDLKIWSDGMDLCELIYRFTDSFPDRERYGLVAQMRRAVVSIPSNIAEGFVRKYPKEFRQFLSVALGSLAELETQAILSGRLGYLADTNLQQVLEAIGKLGKMITKFHQRIRR